MYQVFYLPSFLERSRIGATVHGALPIDFQEKFHHGNLRPRGSRSAAHEHRSSREPLRCREIDTWNGIRVERRNLECGVISWYYY